MDTHIELIHNEMLFKCLLCNKNLSTQNDLKNHHEAVHEGIKPYKCSICNDKFSQQIGLKTNIGLLHNKKNPYRCLVCTK